MELPKQRAAFFRTRQIFAEINGVFILTSDGRGESICENFLRRKSDNAGGHTNLRCAPGVMRKEHSGRYPAYSGPSWSVAGNSAAAETGNARFLSVQDPLEHKQQPKTGNSQHGQNGSIY